MIRLSEIRLPLARCPPIPKPTEAALRAAAAQALGIAPAGIAHVHVFKRSFDARKADLLAVYRRYHPHRACPGSRAAGAARGQSHIQPTPDMAWRPVGQAPAGLRERPVVVGFGPCGIFAALVLAQMAFGPSCWSAARRCASAPRTPGACGASAS
jgi:uncharacterized FAD-dependent dehydrogenase